MSIGSILGGIVSGVKKYGGPLAGTILGGAIGGPAGAVIGGTIGGSIAGGAPRPPTLPGGAMVKAGGGGGIGGFTGRAVQAMGSAGRGIAGAARGAAAMCAKYPQWCLAAGGVAAIASAMQSGQLPIPRKRRGRGITARDLRSFRRVANLVKTYSAPVRHMRTAPRGRKTCR